MRVVQKEGTKGSLKWVQSLVNEHPAVLNNAILSALALEPSEDVDWRSPLRRDDFAEYRDDSWLERIGHPELAEPLHKFWPSRGPQWDALARTGERVILVEAKAHVREIVSPASEAGPKSAVRIGAALEEAKHFFGAREDKSWAGPYYQYANRLAHLYFLRKHEIAADLMFLYIVGDTSMSAGATKKEWDVAIEEAHKALGIAAPIDHVHEVFVDIATLDSRAHP